MTTGGSTTARGYGSAHQAERKRWEPIVATGSVNCANPDCDRPSQPIDPDEPWDVGHTPDRTGYRGPEHMACNRREGGRNGAYATNQKRAVINRDW